MNLCHSRATGALLALALLACGGFAQTASARLGGDAASVQEDSARFVGKLVSTAMVQYDRHDITTSSGTVVHEYLSRAGRIFAVSWKGPLPPDLHQLFGDYFQTLSSAAAAHSQPGSHRQLNVVRDDFVAQSSGHLRAFQGRAYVPSLVPAGVDVSELQ